MTATNLKRVHFIVDGGDSAKYLSSALQNALNPDGMVVGFNGVSFLSKTVSERKLTASLRKNSNGVTVRIDRGSAHNNADGERVFSVSVEPD